MKQSCHVIAKPVVLSPADECAASVPFLLLLLLLHCCYLCVSGALTQWTALATLHTTTLGSVSAWEC